MRWLRALRFEDGCSRATFADYLAAVELLAGRARRCSRRSSSRSPAARTLRWSPGCAAFAGSTRFPRPGCAPKSAPSSASQSPTSSRASSGSCPSERTSDRKRRQGAITKAGPGHARRLLVEAAHHYRRQPAIGVTLARRQQGQDPRVIAVAWRAQRRLYQRWAHLRGGTSRPAWSRSPSRASSPHSSGRPQPLTDTPTIAPGTLPGRARAPGRPTTVARGSRSHRGQPTPAGRARSWTASRDEYRVLRSSALEYRRSGQFGGEIRARILCLPCT